MLLAAQENNDPMIVLLSKLGAHMGEAKPLLAAAERGYKEAAMRLVQLGADVHGRDHVGRTALHHAARHGLIVLAAQLVQGEIEVNAQDATASGSTALHYAAAHGHLPIVQMLVETGIDHEIKNAFGQRPVDMTTDVAVRGYLLGIGQEPKNPFEVAKLEQREWMEELFEDMYFEEYFPEAGVLFNKLLRMGIFPFGQFAALCERIFAEQPKDEDGWTLLHGCVLHDLFADFGVNLMLRGIDVNAATTWGVTPMHLAAEKGNDYLVTALLLSGADVHREDVAGNTAVHFAARGGHMDVVKSLLEAGASAQACNKDGRSPRKEAAQNRHWKLVGLLRSM